MVLIVILCRYGWLDQRILHPLKMFFSGSDFEMQFGDAQVHLGITHERESPVRLDPRLFVALRGQVFEREFLLVDGCRSPKGSLHSLAEPGRSGVTDVAHLFGRLPFQLPARVVRIAQGHHARNLLIGFQGIRPFHFPVGEARPAGAQSQLLGQEN